MNKITLLISVLLVSGCTSNYYYKNEPITEAILNPDHSVLISIPENGNYINTHYTKSGEMTATALANAFVPFANKVALADDCKGYECLQAADYSNYQYYVEPKILHWEDRATEWSGRLDRIQIAVTVYDMNSKQEIDALEFSASSKWTTFGGDHPQDLLVKPFNDYAASLYKGATSQPYHAGQHRP